jgi:ATP-dependent Clp protease ATP-binding subunit ClpA
VFEKFSDGARRALTRAKAEAGARDSDEITLVHVLAGLVHSESEASEALREAGVGNDAIERVLPRQRVDPSTLDPGPIPFSDAAKVWLSECVRQAVTEDGLDAIRTTHLLAALADSEHDEITRPLAAAGIELPTPHRD